MKHRVGTGWAKKPDMFERR